MKSRTPPLLALALNAIDDADARLVLSDAIEEARWRNARLERLGAIVPIHLGRDLGQQDAIAVAAVLLFGTWSKKPWPIVDRCRVRQPRFERERRPVIAFVDGHNAGSPTALVFASVNAHSSRVTFELEPPPDLRALLRDAMDERRLLRVVGTNDESRWVATCLVEARVDEMRFRLGGLVTG